MERQGMPDQEQPHSGRRLGEDAAAIAPLVAILGRLRARARMVLLAASVATLLATVLAVVLALGLLDFALRTPMWLRLGVLIAGIAAAIFAMSRWLLPAWRFRPSLIETALRLERSEAGRKTGLRGILASGLELAYNPPDTAIGRGLAGHVIDSAKRAASSVRASAILNPAPARHGLAMLAACTAIVAMVVLAVGPGLATTGALRILAPWAGAEWPKRTAVVDATDVEVHPLGTSLPLRAAVTRSDREPEQTRVAARYRLVTSSGAETTRRIMLAWQGHTVGLKGDSGDLRLGQVYERLVEPSALAAAAGVDPAEVAEFEYWFETDDDRTRARRIKLVHPPSVLSARASITVPEYVEQAAKSERSTFVSGVRELGAGNDQRAIVGPVLAGSMIELTIRLNKPVRTPAQGASGDEMQRDEVARALASVLPGLEITDDLQMQFGPETWRLSWPARRSIRIGVEPVDEYGIAKLEESVFSFDIVEDRPPSGTIVEPREDEAVLATAVVEVAGEGRDDVGVASISLEQQIARPVRGSAGGAPEASTERTVLTAREWGSGGAPIQATVSGRLDLSTLALNPRDEVWLTALVVDGFIGFNGERHEPVRSAARRLRIISEEELVDQMRAELGALRRVAMRLDEEQAQVQNAVREGEVSGADATRQSALTQRIQQQTSTVQRLMERLERNQLQDEALSGLLEDINSLFRGASRDSNRAAAQMESAARDEHEATQLTPQQAEAIDQSQEAVRDQLGRMAEMLDRGEDSWVMSRTLQRLLQQQRDAQSQTERFGEQTMGRRAEDLTPQERAELQRLQERQEQLAQSARQAMEDLEERAAQMQQADPAQAAAMQQAAERGRQQQVAQRMQEAGESLEQNQTSSATAQQQEAINALEQMLADMNDAQRQRDQALRRMLANLIESLERLVADQTAQIEQLVEAIASDLFDGLDNPMIALSQNTLAVAETARSDRSTVTVAEPLDRAARAQSDAIAALRAAPVRSVQAQQHQIESRRMLVEALEEARRLQQQAQQRDQQRQRAELRRIYREALEEQVAIRGQAEQYFGREIDRRDRMSLRGLGERQEALRLRLDELRRESEDIADAAVFDFAHERLDAAAMLAAKRLRGGHADRAVERNQNSAVRILASLVEALRDLERDDEFRDDGEGGGGGGGGGQGGEPPPLLPPLAELRLLRGLQQGAAELTRELDEARDESAATELNQLGDLQDSLRIRGEELMQKLQQQPQVPQRPTPIDEGEGQ